MDREHTRPAIRVAVAAPFPEIVRIHETTAEYADELEVCAMISSAGAVLEQTRLLQPDVLLLSEGLGMIRADMLARLTALAPGARLVVLVERPGARRPVIADAVVQLDAPPAELRAAIVAAVGHASAPAQGGAARAMAGAPSLRIAPDPGAAPPRPRIPVLMQPSRARSPETEREAGAPGARAEDGTPGRARARTVLVFSGKGGVGKSVVATNLATALAVGGSTVAMIDLNLQFGDVGVLLRLEEHPLSIEAVAQQDDEIDPDLLDRALATSADGVRVLLAPSSPESSDMVSASSLEAILDHLCCQYEYVVVDAPPNLEERIVGVMEVADHILLVTSFGITSVKDTKMTLRLLQSLGIERDRVAVVLNQTRSRISLPAEEIERALRFPVLSNLPYEPRMDECIDSGRPLVVSEPRSGFSRQLRLVIDHVGRPQDPGAAPKQRRHAAGWRLRFGR